MENSSYSIIFEGQLIEGFDLATVQQNLKKLLNADDAAINRIFSGKPVTLKKNLTRSNLEKYQAALTKAGIDTRAEPPIDDQPQPAGESLSLTPKTPSPESSASEDEINPYHPPQRATTTETMVHCRQCGTKIHPSNVVCHNCGARQEVGKSKNKVSAAMLAIFLGFLGAHRFYLGQWWGIFYFFFGLFAWPIAILEGIVFLFTSEERWNEKYSNVTGMGGAGIAIGVVVCVAVVGILAAVAIPAYQDYTFRAKIVEGMPKVEETKQKVEAFTKRTNFVPNSNLDAGLPEKISGPNIKSINVIENGRIEVTYFSTEASAISDETIIWTPTFTNNPVTWDCSGGTLPKKYRPSVCRAGDFQTQQAPTTSDMQTSVDGLLKARIPTGWEALNLNPDASLQFGNKYKEAYIAVIADTKSDLVDFDLRRYGNLVLESYFVPISNDIRELHTNPINGMPAIHYRIDATVDNIRIVYHVALMEGKEHYYQVLAWSLKSRFEGNSEQLKYVVNSLEEQ